MPKYEIEIPDGVLPEGYVPVAYRKPIGKDEYCNPFDSTIASCHFASSRPERYEARLIVAPRPEPKFRKYDFVTLKDYPSHVYVVRTVTHGGSNSQPWYTIRRKGDGYEQTAPESHLEKWVEPQKPQPPALYQVGSVVSVTSLGFQHLPHVRWTVREVYQADGLNTYHVYPDWPLTDIYVAEGDLVPFREPKFKVGDWVNQNDYAIAQIQAIRWHEHHNQWWYDTGNGCGAVAKYLKPTTRVPLTHDDAVKLALGAITPTEIQLENRYFPGKCLDKRTVKAVGLRDGKLVLRFHDAPNTEPYYYAVADLTRLV